jgi:hypothetical protein
MLFRSSPTFQTLVKIIYTHMVKWNTRRCIMERGRQVN